MYFSDGILGSSTANKLRSRPTETLLTIGSDTFSRHDLGAIDCYNFLAASNLSNILNAELKVKNTRELFETISPAMLALPRLGAISLAVLGAAFEAKGIGGDAPLEAWVRKHLGKDKQRTWMSMKEADQKEMAEEKKRARTAKQRRKNRAHELRVERHVERSQAANRS